MWCNILKFLVYYSIAVAFINAFSTPYYRDSTVQPNTYILIHTMFTVLPVTLATSVRNRNKDTVGNSKRMFCIRFDGYDKMSLLW